MQLSHDIAIIHAEKILSVAGEGVEQYFQAIDHHLSLKDQSFFDQKFYDQLQENLQVLGEKDGKLRDEIGWTTFSKLFQSDLFAAKKRKEVLLKLLSDDYLFHCIDRGETDSSVKRSFSILAIADLLYGDAEFGKLLDHMVLSKVSERFRCYLEQERDFRGHVDSLGWVHAMAHTGDALSALALHPNSTETDLTYNMRAVINHVKVRGFDVFKWEEHFRLGRSVGRVLDRIGIEDFRRAFWNEVPSDYMFEQSYAQNLLNMMRCLYLEVHWREPENAKKLEMLKQTIQGP